MHVYVFEQGMGAPGIGNDNGREYSSGIWGSMATGSFATIYGCHGLVVVGVVVAADATDVESK
jgi:hypothetical protein